MNEVTFSVITPVFNGAAFISETVQSVLSAIEGLSAEYLVINDGSTDETLAALQPYDSAIKIVSQINGGQPSAVRNGIKNASGKYCLVVNADDPLMGKELFIHAERTFKVNPEVVVVYPDWQIIDAKNRPIKKRVVKEYSRGELIGNFNCLVGPGGIFRTDLAKQIGGWNSDFKYVPDYDFWLRMSNFGPFKRMPGVMAQWRTHESSISIGSRGLKMAEERIRVMEDFLANNPQPKTLTNAGISSAYFTAAQLAFFDSKVPGRKWLHYAVRKNWKILFKRSLLKSLYLELLPLSRWGMTLIRKLLIKS